MPANHVRAFRERFGLSQPALGELLGVTSRSVYQWEQGEPRRVVLLALRELEREIASQASSATDSVSTALR